MSLQNIKIKIFVNVHGNCNINDIVEIKQDINFRNSPTENTSQNTATSTNNYSTSHFNLSLFNGPSSNKMN